MKMVKKSLLFLFSVVFVFTFVGCSETKQEEPDLGNLDGVHYSNKYFGLEITLPEDWSVQDQETQNQLVETGANLISGDDENKKAMLEEAAKKTLYLLTVFKHPLGTPVNFNPNFMSIAENVKPFPGIKSGKDYLLNTKMLLESSNIQYQFPKDIYSETLDNKNFDVMELAIDLGPMTVKQKYYAAVIKGYALSFVISYTNEEELSSLNQIIESINFE